MPSTECYRPLNYHSTAKKNHDINKHNKKIFVKRNCDFRLYKISNFTTELYVKILQNLMFFHFNLIFLNFKLKCQNNFVKLVIGRGRVMESIDLSKLEIL